MRLQPAAVAAPNPHRATLGERPAAHRRHLLRTHHGLPLARLARSPAHVHVVAWPSLSPLARQAAGRA